MRFSGNDAGKMIFGTVFKVDFFSGINVKIIRANIKYFKEQLLKIQ